MENEEAKREEHINEIATDTAAQVWCMDQTKHIEMNVTLAEAFKIVLAGWIRQAMQYHRNEEYYRGLLDQCAKHIGKTAYTADDGILHDSPLRAKIPELVESLVSEMNQLAMANK